MLHRYISQFLDYCRLVDFSIRSIQALTASLNEFALFLKLNNIRPDKLPRSKASYEVLNGNYPNASRGGKLKPWAD
jgi:hypothetical protein